MSTTEIPEPIDESIADNDASYEEQPDDDKEEDYKEEEDAEEDDEQDEPEPEEEHDQPNTDSEVKKEEPAEDGEGEELRGTKRPPSPKPPIKIPKKRGRKKTKFTFLEEGVFDMDGNPINVTRDEVVIDHEDPKGKEKVDEDGVLKGGRQYRMKTFNVLGSGNKLFMISTEPARLVGFRDSYLLFKTHRLLFKKVCTNEEKMDLIDRGLIPNSYKGRSVNLVAARSIFREFGAKMIRGGRKVIDDFWEQRAIDRGDVPGEFVDPGEFSLHSLMPNFLVDPTATGAGTPVNLTPLVNYQTDVTWLYQIAMRTKEENTKLNEARGLAFTKGIKDTFTNLIFYPESTQPTRAKFSRIGNDSEIRYDTVFENADLRKKKTGLGSVPPEIFLEVSDEIKQAILEQQEYEKT